MRKIAILLFMIFATVQLAPAVMAVFTNSATVFIADEEKGEEKASSTDYKEKKDYAAFTLHTTEFANKINIAFHLSDKMIPSPCLEKLTPPPNFC